MKKNNTNVTLLWTILIVTLVVLVLSVLIYRTESSLVSLAPPTRDVVNFEKGDSNLNNDGVIVANEIDIDINGPCLERDQITTKVYVKKEAARCHGTICTENGAEETVVEDFTTHVTTEIYKCVDRKWVHICDHISYRYIWCRTRMEYCEEPSCGGLRSIVTNPFIRGGTSSYGNCPGDILPPSQLYQIIQENRDVFFEETGLTVGEPLPEIDSADYGAFFCPDEPALEEFEAAPSRSI